MNSNPDMLKDYFLAVIAPLVATAAGFIINSHLHHSNITLVYLLAVLVVAVRTSIGPALFSALSGFLMYNFFFTEPRYSFVIFHREDILTVCLFLLMAALAGHQAARLRRQVLVLQARSEFAKTQLHFLQQVAGDINNRQVFIGLHAALSELPTVTCFIIEPGETDFDVSTGYASPDSLDTDIIRELMSGRKVVISGCRSYYALDDGINVIAVAGILFDSKQVESKTVLTEHIESLVFQATLALGRSRLARDLEKERVDKERELLRSTLLTSVSHDLRTPLSSMIGSASSLIDLKESLSDSQKHELLETILQEASRLDGYIQNLLDMTRLGYSGLRLERDWIGLDEILSVVIRRIKPSLKGHNIRISMAANIPLLYVHAALIEQAVYNVLENAVKYSPAGTDICINAVVDKQYIIIDISDSGSGIPEAEREQVFNMFYTIDRKDQHSAGTGLGLAICKGMIGAHGGKVEILDKLNDQGTLIRLSIPVISRDESDMPEEAQ